MRADLILVGGGLASGLLGWRLRQRRPDLRVVLLESQASLGGNHTWSWHEGDLTAAQHDWIAPLVSHRWPRHEVRFPDFRRTLHSGYASITSAQFDHVLRGALAESLLLQTPVRELRPTEVVLHDGRKLRAGAVIDGRGVPPWRHLELGWQKFLGQQLLLEAPHRLAGPVLMDATVPQQEGYRFVYTLPLDERTVLVEDTFYADAPALDEAGLRANIQAYVRSQGWRVAAIQREERGVLPIALGGDMRALWDEADGVSRIGLSGALFHPTTGYSLPEAVRVADLVAGLPEPGGPALFAALRAHALARWHDGRFFRLLNRMLFRASEPQGRWRVMQRFYRLPDPLVGRFYAGRLTLADQIRLVCGKPPVPLGPAIRAAFGGHPPRAAAREGEAS